MPLSFELSQGSKLRLYVDLTFADTSLVLLGPRYDFPLAGLPTLLVGFVLTVAMVQRVIFESPVTQQNGIHYKIKPKIRLQIGKFVVVFV